MDRDFLIRAAVVLVPIVIWAVNAAIRRPQQEAKKRQQQQQQQQARRPANPPRPVPGGAPPQPAAAVPAQAQRDEVEEFLARMAQRRGQQRPPEVEIRPAGAGRGQPDPQRVRPAQPPRPPAPLPSDIVHAELGTQEVGEHVEAHLDTSEFEQHAKQLSKLDQADEKLEARLHQRFDHKLGDLQQQTERKRTSPPKQSAPVSALSLASAFSNRTNLRQAIILQEVLRRPDFDL